MRIYDFAKVDSQGRLCLSGMVEEGETLRPYVDSQHLDTIRLEKVKDENATIGKLIKVDKKGRVVIPASFREFFKLSTVMVSYDDSKDEVVLSLPRA